MKKIEGGDFLIGLLVGATLGGMAAVLLSPVTGRKLRRDLSRRGKKLAHRMSETVEEIRDRGTDAYERARESLG